MSVGPRYCELLKLGKLVLQSILLRVKIICKVKGTGCVSKTIGLEKSTIQGCMQNAVSYTHLDVYKRQALRLKELKNCL